MQIGENLLNKRTKIHGLAKFVLNGNEKGLQSVLLKMITIKNEKEGKLMN